MLAISYHWRFEATFSHRLLESASSLHPIYVFLFSKGNYLWLRFLAAFGTMWTLTIGSSGGTKPGVVGICMASGSHIQWGVGYTQRLRVSLVSRGVFLRLRLRFPFSFSFFILPLRYLEALWGEGPSFVSSSSFLFRVLASSFLSLFITSLYSFWVVMFFHPSALLRLVLVGSLPLARDLATDGRFSLLVSGICLFIIIVLWGIFSSSPVLHSPWPGSIYPPGVWWEASWAGSIYPLPDVASSC